MTKYYFKHDYSEKCYEYKYFYNYMKEFNLTEMVVYEAIKEKFNGIFWCKKYEFCGDDTINYCGKQCEYYSPRNGKNGRCRFHTNDLYVHGDKITLKLKK